MKWTDERPTKPGWYWWKLTPQSDPTVVEVRSMGLVMVMRHFDVSDRWETLYPSSQWAGPIMEPEG